jgi:flagellar M-ring protein FliF
MPQGPTVWVARAREKWEHISRAQQIALVAGVAMTIVLIVGFVIWSQQTSYGVLFSNLQSQDASAIVTQLKAQKIPYQIQDNGTVIEVPASMVDETRLMLAGDGLPSQGVVGFEIFDKANPLDLTDFMQQVDYQRALEGQLTRTIEQINRVSSASVSIVMPQSSLYTSQQQSPTASILLSLAPGVTLDPGQVKAIMHLTASAVQGLTPDNVTVVDTQGDNLSDEVNSGTLSNGVSLATYGTALDVEQAYEQRLSQEAMSMLDTVLGPNKAVVRVNALLNWDQLQEDSTTYGQQPSQIASQNSSNTTSNGSSSSTSGIPGTGSNLVPTPTATAGSGSQAYTQSQTNTVYDVSQTVDHLVKAPGSVQRLTVAVFLDGQYPAATVASIQQAVSNAIGLNATRGDAITVTAIPFNHTTDVAAQNALKAQQQQALLSEIWRGAALALVALALVLFALRATRRGAALQTAGTSVTLVNESLLSGPSASLLGTQGQGALAAPQDDETQSILLTSNPAEALVAARQRQLAEAEQARFMETRQQLLATAHEHPDLLANVILSWYEEAP